MPQRTCRVCPAPITGRQDTAVYCSWKCREVWRYQQKRLRADPSYKPRVTNACTAPGCEGKHLARGLCQRHYRAARRAEGAAWATLGGGKNNARSRARHYGVRYEPIDPVTIYERDAWTCGICHQPVDPTLKHPDPMSASLDHITPLARGGHHEHNNVQCSHLTCNLAKQHRIAA